MKQKLLFLTLFVTSICYSQIAINDLFNAPVDYTRFASNTDPAPNVDESPTGPNATWNFDGLIKIGDSQDALSTPTAAEIAIYPGTTSVLTTTNTNNAEVTKTFLRETGNTIYTTCFDNPNLTLNYDDVNLTMATYPFSYGNAAETSAIEGSFSYTGEDSNGNTVTFDGTFAGTGTSSVDAYGTLTTTIDGKEEFNGSVTRVKGVQNLNLTHSTFGPVGTMTLTSQGYFDNNGDIMFRSNRFEIDVNIAILGQSFSDNIVSYEGVLFVTLGTNQTELASNTVKIVPNPVVDFLNISVPNNQVIKSIILTDATGKEVLKSKGENSSLSVNHLQTGFYIANVTTENDCFTLKFIKN